MSETKNLMQGLCEEIDRVKEIIEKKYYMDKIKELNEIISRLEIMIMKGNKKPKSTKSIKKSK